MLTNLKIHTVLLALALSGCNNYNHYGLEIGSSDSTLKQEDLYYITGNYEFKSVLFISDDKKLSISIRHPVHPIPEPEKFIAQIEFDLKDKNKTLLINSILFEHQKSDGKVIIPVEKKQIRSDFYVLFYNKSQLPDQIIENIKINYTYNGKKHNIVFNETVQKVKRWNKMKVLINS